MSFSKKNLETILNPDDMLPLNDNDYTTNRFIPVLDDPLSPNEFADVIHKQLKPNKSCVPDSIAPGFF